MVSPLVLAFMRDAKLVGKDQITQPVKMQRENQFKAKEPIRSVLWAHKFYHIIRFPNENNIFEYVYFSHNYSFSA